MQLILHDSYWNRVRMIVGQYEWCDVSEKSSMYTVQSVANCNTKIKYFDAVQYI
jgi:hypothetical protein